MRETLKAQAERLDASNKRLIATNEALALDVQRLQIDIHDLHYPKPVPPRTMNLKVMEEAIGQLLVGMGVDPEHPDFLDTPRRVAKMYKEMLTPEPNSWATFPAAASDMIILRGHKVIGICPHHLQPVEISCCVGYIPNKLVVGLSKLARVVEEQLTRPQTQEELAESVAKALDLRLEPKGVGVVLAGVHGCMRFRGIESQGDVVCSVMRGVLLLNPAARAEFLQLIGRP